MKSIQHRCPITYETLTPNQFYSVAGLKKLSPQLKQLNVFPLSAESQRIEARKRAQKMSIQGVQLKLSAKLNITHGKFEIVDARGKFILKPPHELYPELPANEAITMQLAKLIGIETPLSGLIYCQDNSFTYFIKRFDRAGHSQKIALEDFAQLSGETRETKYNFTMEKLIPLLDQFCTFPLLEKSKLFTRILFNFLIGNEDMHLKNFSLIIRDKKVELAPAYDFLNTTIALENAKEEMALSLNGKKNRLKKSDFIDYYAHKKLKLNKTTIENILQNISKKIPDWQEWIKISFLTPKKQKEYLQLLSERTQRLGL